MASQSAFRTPFLLRWNNTVPDTNKDWKFQNHWIIDWKENQLEELQDVARQKMVEISLDRFFFFFFFFFFVNF